MNNVTTQSVMGESRKEDYLEDPSRWYVVVAENVTFATHFVVATKMLFCMLWKWLHRCCGGFIWH